MRPAVALFAILATTILVEKYPYGLLTMIVSLEAIFLSTLVMISQNRADAKRQAIADQQWQTVKEEDEQNEQLLELSNQILELTRAIHEYASPQARTACLPPAAGRAGRFEFDYRRHGTLAYLAGWDVHQANLFHRVEDKTGISPFGRLVDDVITTEPYASARTVFWIVDNGSSHAGNASVERVEEKWKHARLIHLPIHASWLNQIELYFSIVQRKALTPNDFDSIDALRERLLRFGEHYRQIAQPFDWTFARSDLDRLLDRIEHHEPQLRLAA